VVPPGWQIKLCKGIVAWQNHVVFDWYYRNEKPSGSTVFFLHHAFNRNKKTPSGYRKGLGEMTNAVCHANSVCFVNSQAADAATAVARPGFAGSAARQTNPLSAAKTPSGYRKGLWD
jgi:hypothetical protein